MNKQQHILIAEDDENIRRGLVDTLESEGYRVTSAENGQQALETFSNGPVDLLLLDIMMPGKSGYDVCREIRKTNTTVPIILLTAKGEEIDKVVGLELGADDYVTKPFGVRELLARISAVLRRSQQRGAAIDASNLPNEFNFGTAQINKKTYSGTLDGNSFDLSSREMKLIEIFTARPGEVLTRDDLLNEAWGVDYFGTTRTLDQHISQLRKKVEPDIKNPIVICTVHGIGYKYLG